VSANPETRATPPRFDLAGRSPGEIDASWRRFGAAAAQQGARIKWDDSAMKSSYANVCNVTSTREEVVMLFGINQAWNRGQSEVTIQLTDRIIVSPYAAKRLVALLQGVVQEYEKRFGTLNMEGPAVKS